MSVTTSAGKEAAKGSAPIMIVSCDTHIGPRLMEDLRVYCPQNLLDAFDDYAGGLQKKREAAAANKEKVSFGGNSVGPDWGVRFANLETPGHYDMHARLRDLDNDGVAAEVMFHDSQNGEPIPFLVDTLLMRGRDRIRTSACSVLVSASKPMARRCVFIEPERHIGLMHLPMWDMDAALDELQWARSVGLKGLEFPLPEALHAALQRSGVGRLLLGLRGPRRDSVQPRRGRRERRRTGLLQNFFASTGS